MNQWVVLILAIKFAINWLYQNWVVEPLHTIAIKSPQIYYKSTITAVLDTPKVGS